MKIRNININKVKSINFENLPEDVVIIYCDGSCNWKNRFGGYGVFLVDGENKVEFFEGEKDTTIGRMELKGVISSLQLLQSNEEAVIYCDSEYATNCVNKNWLKDWNEFKFVGKKNADLLEIYWNEYNRFEKGKITIKHISGHSGYEGNEKADELAKFAYEQAKKGYNKIEKFVNSKKI
jgi:ribonuclease HI